MAHNMIYVDGSSGGQVLRYSLALSIALQKPFTIKNIRRNRPKRGIMPQHLYSIRAAKEVGKAIVTGDRIGSEELIFVPKGISRRTVDIDIPTAGSVTLALQSILLPLMIGRRTISINLKGGTDVPYSTPIDFFANVIAYNLKDYCTIETYTMRRGFYPKGGGNVIVKIKPKYTSFERMKEIEMWNIGKLMQVKGIIYSNDDNDLMEILRLSFDVPTNITHQKISYDKGYGIVLWGLVNEGERQIAIGYDELLKEEPTTDIAKRILNGIDFNFIDEHTADNIIPMMAMIGGRIKIKKMTEHIRSAISVSEMFTEKKFTFENSILECH